MQNQNLTKAPPTQPRVTENDVESDCIEYLKALGWRSDRNNRGLYYTPDGRKQMIGRKGQCDWRFVRRLGAEMQYFEVEFKSPKGVVSKEQLEYIAILRHYRIPAWVIRSLDDLKVALITEGFDGYSQDLRSIAQSLKPIVIDCPLCGRHHAKPQPPGGICGWCLQLIEPGTEHHPTEPCCDCRVVRL